MKFVSESVDRWLRDTRKSAEMEPTSILMSKCILPPPSTTSLPSFSSPSSTITLNPTTSYVTKDPHLPPPLVLAVVDPNNVHHRPASFHSPNKTEPANPGFPFQNQELLLRGYDLAQSSTCINNPNYMGCGPSTKAMDSVGPDTRKSSRECLILASEKNPTIAAVDDRVPMWLMEQNRRQNGDGFVFDGKMSAMDPDGHASFVDFQQKSGMEPSTTYSGHQNQSLIRPTLTSQRLRPSYAQRYPVEPPLAASLSCKNSVSDLLQQDASSEFQNQNFPPNYPSLPGGNGGTSFFSLFGRRAPLASQEPSLGSSSTIFKPNDDGPVANSSNLNINYLHQQQSPDVNSKKTIHNINYHSQHHTTKNSSSNNSISTLCNDGDENRMFGKSTGRNHPFATIENVPISAGFDDDESTTDQSSTSNLTVDRRNRIRPRRFSGAPILSPGHHQQNRTTSPRIRKKSATTTKKSQANDGERFDSNGAFGQFRRSEGRGGEGSGHEEDDSGIFKEENGVGDSGSLDSSLSPSSYPTFSISSSNTSSEEGTGDNAAGHIDNPPLFLRHESCSRNSPRSIMNFTDSSVRRSETPPDQLKPPISYAETKDVIGGFLSLCSQIFHRHPSEHGKLTSTSKSLTRININLVRQYFRIIDVLPFLNSLPENELSALKSKFVTLCQTPYSTKEQHVDIIHRIRSFTDKCFEPMAKIVCRLQILLYEMAGGRDVRNVEGALKDFSHMALLSSETGSLYIIQIGSVKLLVSLCREMEAKPRMLRLSLRALAIVCGLPKGCVQLLSLGGLDLILSYLLHQNDPAVSVEAAGVLTQLTAPSHSFAAMPQSLPEIVQRLLDLCDWSKTCETFLLCVGSLGNLSLHHSSVSLYLYRYQGPLRLTRALSQCSKSQSTYIFDQIATILSRLSVNGFDDCLIAQGAIPCLLRLLQTHDDSTRQRQRHGNLAQSVRYKAAISLGSIGSRSAGLKAIHKANGTTELRNALESSNPDGNIENTSKCMEAADCCLPTETMIARSLLNRLTEKYPLESVV